MAYTTALSHIQDFLAEDIQDADTIRRHITEAGVSTANLEALEGSPSEMWHAALAYLDRIEKVGPVVRRAAQTTYEGGARGKQLVALLQQHQEASAALTNAFRSSGSSAGAAGRARPKNPRREYIQKMTDEVRDRLGAAVGDAPPLDPDEALLRVVSLQDRIHDLDSDHPPDRDDTLKELMELTVAIARSVSGHDAADRHRWSSVFGAIGPACVSFGESCGSPYHEVMELASIFWDLEQESAKLYNIAQLRASTQSANTASGSGAGKAVASKPPPLPAANQAPRPSKTVAVEGNPTHEHR